MLGTTRVLEVHWSATHVVLPLPTWHPEARMHGHQWVAELHVTDSGEDLVLRDWDAVEREVSQWAARTLNHQHLNEVMPGTTNEEDVAAWLFARWAPRLENLSQVRLTRSVRRDQWVTFTPDSGQ